VFRPEFLNRLDDVIVFRHLQEGDLKNIVEFELAKVRGQLADKGLALELTDDAKQFLINKGTNLDMGARPLRRSIENHVIDPLSEELLQGRFQGKDKIIVDAVAEETGEGDQKKRKLKSLKFEGVVTEQHEPVGAK
jgi:ATP-dependent Clp protease ATP-binding subunit ClpC